MALFMKKNEVGSHAPLYNVSAQHILMVVGLGNIGPEYDGTRHNIGFEAIDYCAAQYDAPWALKKDLKAYVASTVMGSTRVLFVKPTTFMNLSGEAVQAVAHFYKVPQKDMLIVHDELDIDFGRIRTSNDGSHAGNNGIKSIISVFGEQFSRLRIGIGPKTPAQIDAADFVLGTFTTAQQKDLPLIIKEVASMVADRSAGSELLVETRTVLF
jgi:PTH1 family peptidyl-tRNA hydrolase